MLFTKRSIFLIIPIIIIFVSYGLAGFNIIPSEYDKTMALIICSIIIISISAYLACSVIPQKPSSQPTEKHKLTSIKIGITACIILVVASLAVRMPAANNFIGLMSLVSGFLIIEMGLFTVGLIYGVKESFWPKDNHVKGVIGLVINLLGLAANSRFMC